MLLKPIRTSSGAYPYLLEDLPPLLIGGAVFNTQYTNNPDQTTAKNVLRYGFENGINALDTSPYYGPSEILIGESLKQLAIEENWTREKYFICTKAGRVELDTFDYSPEHVRYSVLRSLERLNTKYLDLVYMHDIEFVTKEEIFNALMELKKLKCEGYIRYIGISGYPVKLLYDIAYECNKGSYSEKIGALDAILSYSNGCIQNTILFEMYQRFFTHCGIKKLLNGSILSMSLLRSSPTHSFHPGSDQLKQKVSEIANYLLKEKNTELADLATRFAYKRWLFDTKPHQNDPNCMEWNEKCSIVLGVSNVEELKSAIINYWTVKTNASDINTRDIELFNLVKSELGENHYNETWKSGIEH